MKIVEIAASILIAGFIASQAVAAVIIQKPAITLSLPDGWIEIPQDVLSAMHEKIKQQTPNAKIPKYDYGFQLASSKNWMEYPYVLLQVNSAGRIPEHQLKSMPKIDLNEKLKDVTSALPSIVNNAVLGQMQYDETAHIVWVTSQSEVVGIGKVLGISGLIPTEKGSVNIHAYSLESNFEDYLPIFRQLIASTTVPPELVYKPHWTDSVPILSGIDWGKVTGNAIIGGLVGLLIAFFAGTKRKKKDK